MGSLVSQRAPRLRSGLTRETQYKQKADLVFVGSELALPRTICSPLGYTYGWRMRMLGLKVTVFMLFFIQSHWGGRKCHARLKETSHVTHLF